MKQRSNLGATKFGWPKFPEVIDWKLNGHHVIYRATFRLTKIKISAMTLKMAHDSANHSP